MTGQVGAPPPGRGPVAWMAGHSVTANLLMLLFLVGGLIFATQIKRELFPDFELDQVNVTIEYPGASPEEVERGVLLAVEEAVEGLEGIKKITATASEGRGTVAVEILEGENIDRIARDIEGEIDRITSFPEDAEEPQVTIADRKRYVVSLALYGGVDERVLREMAEELRDRLLQDADITQAELVGVRDLEIAIEIRQEALRTYGLTLEQVAAAVRRTALEMPGGTIKTAAGDILVRLKERRDWAREFGRIPVISAADGTALLLEQIAEIRDDFEETDTRAAYNGQPAVLVEVYRVGDQTPISVSDAVRRVIETVRPGLPPGMGIDIRNDRSDVYRQRLDLLLRNGYIGLSLVFVLLAVFLEVRLAFWVSLGIPISFAGSLLILDATGTSINMITMFAFIVTLGIVVDDAIVVGENIYHHRQQGMAWHRAAVAGAREIALPINFSVLTNMVAFVPMFFVPGFMGKVFRQVPIVVISVFAVSLIESLFILPAHVGGQKDRAPRGPLGWMVRTQQRFSGFFTRQIHSRFGPLLDLALGYRYATVALGISLLLVTLAYVRSGRMGFELFPKIESDYALATVRLPYGTALARTEAVQQRLVTAAKAVAAENGGPELVEGIFADIDANAAKIRVYLTPSDRRPVATARYTDLWRQRVGPVAGVEYMRFESDAGGPGSGPALSVELSHRSVKVLEKAGETLAQALEAFPNVTDIDDGYSPGKQQLDFKIRQEAEGLGLKGEDVARQVRHAFYGVEALRQQRGRHEVTVRIRLPRQERESEYYLEEMVLRTPSGGEIGLRDAVDITRGRAYTSIDRRDGRRIITVSADVRPRAKAGEILAALRAGALPDLQQCYPGLGVSFEGRQADQRESMQGLTRGLLLALLVIYVMLAVPFNSYIQPLIIMLSIPFGIVGAVGGHLLMGYSLSVVSVFGIVALSGVVINDSLVLIDWANRRRLGGQPAGEAIREAAIHRFRPILLTTLTTFGGLAPMIFETSRQARYLIPMALSLGYGILFATLITLLLVPCLYLVVDDIQGLYRRDPPAQRPVPET